MHLQDTAVGCIVKPKVLWNNIMEYNGIWADIFSWASERGNSKKKHRAQTQTIYVRKKLFIDTGPYLAVCHSPSKAVIGQYQTEAHVSDGQPVYTNVTSRSPLLPLSPL